MTLTGLRKIYEYDLCLWMLYVAVIWSFRVEVHELPSYFVLSLNETVIIFWLGVASIFLNVIPKYINRTGANRHFNDQTQKKFLTRNYIRLLLHILGGGFEFLFTGMTVWNHHHGIQSYDLQTIKIVSIFLDFVHTTTIIIMIRNSDGVMMLRNNNTFFALIKCFFSMKLWFDCPTLDASIPYISALFIFTSGFMTTRIYSFIVAMLQLSFGMTFKTMAENWYSVGEFLAQLIIVARTGSMGLASACFPLVMYHFKHELWTKKNGLRNQTVFFGLLPFTLFFTQSNDAENYALHLAVHIILGVYTFFYAGAYFKRQPVLGTDFSENDEKVLKSAKNPVEGRSDSEAGRALARGWNRASYYRSWTNSPCKVASGSIAKASLSVARPSGCRAAEVLTDLSMLPAPSFKTGRVITTTTTLTADDALLMDDERSRPVRSCSRSMSPAKERSSSASQPRLMPLPRVSVSAPRGNDSKKLLKMVHTNSLRGAAAFQRMVCSH